MNTEINTFVDVKQLLGLDKVAKLLDISKRAVQRLIAAHKLPQPIKIGRLSKLTAGEVETYIEELKNRRDSKEKGNE